MKNSRIAAIAALAASTAACATTQKVGSGVVAVVKAPIDVAIKRCGAHFVCCRQGGERRGEDQKPGFGNSWHWRRFYNSSSSRTDRCAALGA